METVVGYVNFGFIEPVMRGKVLVDSQNGETWPDQVDGKLVARVSLGLDVLARLQHQMQRVFQNIPQVKQPVSGTIT